MFESEKTGKPFQRFLLFQMTTSAMMKETTVNKFASTLQGPTNACATLDSKAPPIVTKNAKVNEKTQELFLTHINMFNIYIIDYLVNNYYQNCQASEIQVNIPTIIVFSRRF